jgi:hypothetical protein
MKLNINYILPLLLLISCGKKDTTEKNFKVKENVKSDIYEQSVRDLNSIEDILASGAPNLALANYLIKSLDLNNKELQKVLLTDFGPDDLAEITEQLKSIENEVKANFLFRGEAYENDRNLLKKSILANKDQASYSFSEQVKFTSLNQIKNKALNEIISTYDKRSQEISKDFSVLIARDMAKTNPMLVREIEKQIHHSNEKKIIHMIRNSKEFISKMDELFKHSELSESEQYTVVAGEVIAFGIYKLVEDKKTFKNIIREGKKVIDDINELREKGKEFLVLTSSLKKHLSDTKENLDTLNSSLSQASKDIKESIELANFPIGGDKNKILNFIYNDILLGKKTSTEGVTPSILSKKRDVSENISKSLTSFNNLNNNLTNILETTQKVSELFGVKPSKEVENIISKAKVVSEVTQTVSNVVAGWASGGPLGVISALSVSPIPGLSQKSIEQDMLQEVSRKLDIVLSNQEQILKNQFETMKMIKELALILHTNHTIQMSALAELRDITLINLEATQVLLKQDIDICDQIIFEQLQKKSRTTLYNSSENLKLSSWNSNFVFNSFESTLSGTGNLNSFLSSNLESRFSECRRGFGNVFSSGSSLESNPLRNVFNTSTHRDVYSFQNKTYLPLLQSIRNSKKDLNFNSIPLHLPVRSVKDIRMKHLYVNKNDLNHPQIGEENYYLLDTLIFTKGLEKSVHSLILLHPFIDMEKNTWDKSVAEISRVYLQNHLESSSLSFLYLQNALRLTQSTISQEAILAGEPLLETIRLKYADKIFTQKYCQEEKLKDAPKSDYPLLCSIRGNKLLLKNYLKYILFEKFQANPSLYKEYTKAIKAKDALKISYILGTGVNEKSILFNSFFDDTLKATVNVYMEDHFESIALPSAKEIEEGKMTYSENIETLLNIQEALLNELVKVTPAYDSVDSSKLLKALVLRNLN